MAESNSQDLAGGVNVNDRTEELHAWTEFSARMGSRLAQAFYVERQDAVVVSRHVSRHEEADTVVYTFETAVPFDVDDLVARLERASLGLAELAGDARAHRRGREFRRLSGKAEGVRLALSYIREMHRG